MVVRRYFDFKNLITYVQTFQGYFHTKQNDDCLISGDNTSDADGMSDSPRERRR